MKQTFLSLAIMIAFCAATTLANAQDRQPDLRFGEWIEPFNGENFEGWHASKPKVDSINWEIEADGSIANNADPGKRKHNIATDRKFQHFMSEIDFKIAGENEGNAGLYMRGRAEMQIRDSYGKLDLGEDEAMRHVGALYKYRKPLVDASRPVGEWNSVRLAFVSTFFNIELNGQLVQNNTFITGPTGAGRKDAFDSPGIYELQGDHDTVWFRNIRIRPMFEAPGWRRLDNGKDFAGWSSLDGEPIEWSIEDGVITNSAGKAEDLRTIEDFHNYLIYYQYKSEGNSGVFLSNLWEIQIHATHGAPVSTKNDGALYDTFPAKVNATAPTGEWNFMEVKVEDRKITSFQNGMLTHDEAVCPARTYSKGDSSNMDAPGPIRLQGDHGRVWFANIFILPLD